MCWTVGYVVSISLKILKIRNTIVHVFWCSVGSEYEMIFLCYLCCLFINILPLWQVNAKSDIWLKHTKAKRKNKNKKNKDKMMMMITISTRTYLETTTTATTTSKNNSNMIKRQ